MNHVHNTDRAAIKVEIDRLHQIGDKADASIGQGISRRIKRLEKKLDLSLKPTDERAKAA